MDSGLSGPAVRPRAALPLDPSGVVRELHGPMVLLPSTTAHVDVPRGHLRVDALTEEQVAGYLAKYATKSTEATGHTSSRLTADDVTDAARRDDHVGWLIAACWNLGRQEADELAARITAKPVPARLGYARLRRWAHMLGFGGHFSTKSRR